MSSHKVDSILENNNFPVHIGPVFPCALCKTNFINLFFLEKHTKKSTKRSKRKKKSNEICQKQFAYPSSLLYHSQTHSPFKCEECGKRFNSNNSLRVHQRIHTGYKPYTCIICEKKFSIKSCLKIHLRTIHVGEKPFKCETCNKHFASQNYLKIHQRVHTGEKPFKCEICDRYFSQKSSLQSHRLRIHSGCHCQKCKKELVPYTPHMRTNQCATCEGQSELQGHHFIHIHEQFKKQMNDKFKNLYHKALMKKERFNF